MFALPHKLKINNKCYVAEKQLGRGAEGAVYKGYEENNPTQLAIKICSNMRDDELKFLQKHVLKKELSNLIKYHEISVATQEQPIFIFVMELAEGNLLENIIQKPINLELKEVLEISLQIAKGIQSIHKLGFMHRDLKPENIVKVANQWKICDFGLSRHKLSSHLTQKIGTAYYIAPEMLGNLAGEDEEIECYNQQVDIWALGCIIYEIQTKNLFFDGNSFDTITYKINQYAVDNLSRNPPENLKFQRFPHKPLGELLQKMLIVIPDLRITIDKVIEEIENLKKQLEEQQKGNNDAFKTFKPIVNVMQTGGLPIVPKQPIEFNKPSPQQNNFIPQQNKPSTVEQKQVTQPLISGQPLNQFQFQQQNPQIQQFPQNAQKPLNNQSFPQLAANAFATFIPSQNPQNQQNLQPQQIHQQPQNQVPQINFQGQNAQNIFPAQTPKFNQNSQHPINAQQPINALNQQNPSQITNQPQNINIFGQIPQESKPLVASQFGIPPPQPQPQINGNQFQFGQQQGTPQITQPQWSAPQPQWSAPQPGIQGNQQPFNPQGVFQQATAQMKQGNQPTGQFNATPNQQQQKPNQNNFGQPKQEKQENLQSNNNLQEVKNNINKSNQDIDNTQQPKTDPIADLIRPAYTAKFNEQKLANDVVDQGKDQNRNIGSFVMGIVKHEFLDKHAEAVQ